MTADHERTPAPSHWHVFRREEDGGKQYLLPIYSRHSDAVAAVAGLKEQHHREYGVEACQDHPCQI